MGLRIVYGRAGSGKTAFCLTEIKNRLSSGNRSGSGCGRSGSGCGGNNKRLILIVPEQFSLQAEKNLAKISGFSGAPGAEVLSFRRMAFRVFSEVGGIARRHLNAAGKSMLLFKIINNLGSELKFFSKAALRKGFTEILSDAITEFKRYDVTPEQLDDAANRLEDGLPLKDKLFDLAKVYAEFEELLHRNYLDADDDLTELYKKLDLSRQFDGAEIWIDEFSGFTPQEYKVIGKLLKKAARVTICLCTDCLSNEPGGGMPMVFEPVRKTAAKLLRMAGAEGIAIEKPVKLGSEDIMPRFAVSEELGHLEQNFFKYPYKKFTKYSGDVRIVSSANMFAEVEDAARDIIRLCREEGFRYRDIAVTMRNPESYAGIVKSVFTRFGIPFFFDGKRDIEGHPLVVFILSALDIFTGNWSYEPVFRYAKTGLTGIDREELDLLENYVLANGIRGSAWTCDEDWDYPIDGSDRKGERSAREQELLAVINAARKKLVEPLAAFRNKTKGGVKAAEFCTALFELLCETGADKKVAEFTQKFMSEGLLEKAEEYRQVWNIAMDVFSQIVEVLGDESIGAERFAEILAAGFSGHKISLIPPALDQVLAGNIERARSHDIKALYILGVNEGVIPGGRGEEGLFSDVERDSLEQFGLELAGNTKTRCLEERFMLYMALATPSRYLWLSYPTADRDGRALRPSRILSEIKRILPLVIEESTVIRPDGEDIPQPAAPLPAFDEMAAQLRKCYDGGKVHDGWKDIYNWFNRHDGWKDKVGIITSGLGYTNQPQRLAPERAARLYGKPVFSSISRMEAYASCPFSHFVRYGLKARERRLFRFDPVDAGTFMHNIIDEFSRMLVKEGISWRNLDAGWCFEQISRLVEKKLAAGGSSILASSKRYRYLSDRLKKTVARAVMLISKHIGMSSFEPSGYEVEFGEHGRYPPITIELPSGECIKLTGRIDRIDSMTNEDGTYLRIIDYKSGNRALRLDDVYFGLQLQLVTYMDAVLGMEESSGGDIIGINSGVGANDGAYAANDSTAANAVSSADETGASIAANAAGSAYASAASSSTNAADASSSINASGASSGANAASSASRAGVQRMLPAGILYFRLDNPLIRCGRGASDEEIEKAIMKELRMKGLILADAKLVKEMDREIDGDSLIIPARINKDGSLGRAAAATREQFEILRRHVRKTLAAIGYGIINGSVEISPYKKNTITACTYCSLSSVCQFDTSMSGNRYRILSGIGDDELWELMGRDITYADKLSGKPAGAGGVGRSGKSSEKQIVDDGDSGEKASDSAIKPDSGCFGKRNNDGADENRIKGGLVEPDWGRFGGLNDDGMDGNRVKGGAAGNMEGSGSDETADPGKGGGNNG